ncbi:putative Lipid A core-O-antigen ligase and related enzyme [Vibrio nigripulchritudo SOn1]|uniref:Lipid A core-O-antigen ligase and related enzyme n=1 Tax=Vibrio nigripulchritudo SOn1 TaxID=1238450 RepID=A0AAV2VRM7_9VIBR|nr:O-antigen ligase family protein [Vibrio nigripulchritudo]CCO47282.1 putative Lipid A core-O-antigen ligase and related enzyme [Vibrio nigripulchritudo SOn1]
MLIRRDSFNFFCLTVLFYLVLVRSTNMGFGYPAAQHLLSNISYTPQKFMQMALLGLIALFFFFTGKRVLVQMRISLLAYIIISFSLLSILFSPNSSLALRYLISVSVVSIPIFLYYRYYGPEALYNTLVTFFTAVVVLNVLYVIVFPQYAIMNGVHAGSWRGLFVHKNGAGSFFAVISIIFFQRWWFESKCRDMKQLSLFLCCLLMVIMSKSITALLTMMVVMTTFFFVRFVIAKPLIGQKIVLLAFYSVGLIFSVTLLNVFLYDILILLGKDPTLTGRTGLWEVLFGLIFERPLFGYGIGVFSRPEIMYQYSSAFGWAAKTTHSSYMDLALGIGIPGSIAVFIWIGKSMFSALMAKTLTHTYEQQLAVAISVITGGLTIASASSGVLLSNAFIWVLVLSMVLFCHSREIEDETQLN